MYSKILVPTDLTEKSELAIHQALRLAQEFGGSVQLLHVIEKLSDGNGDQEVEAFYSKLSQNAQAKLKEWQKQYEADYNDIDIETSILVGKRAQEILKTVEMNKIQLIVMTSHNYNKNDDNSFGTLSHQIALFSPCSVLVVR